ncbi:hypothetical protein [Paractinoplanes toevensis]|uniref:Uncharacterized protein n=1 Tax=Paractinoplanes toevensis TaxID=571911 RepID=A0A919WB61_9ACTN|nr:hypothetical protein [Actinoplanes toevensis]GIM96982.1 hypothetical protein Ato02nite_087750 [Actinoplanes toevensis]
MEPIGDPDDDQDFAEEHEQTTVDPAVSSGEDDGEPESPEGWDGLDGDGPP